MYSWDQQGTLQQWEYKERIICSKQFSLGMGHWAHFRNWEMFSGFVPPSVHLWTCKQTLSVHQGSFAKSCYPKRVNSENLGWWLRSRNKDFWSCLGPGLLLLSHNSYVVFWKRWPERASWPLLRQRWLLFWPPPWRGISILVVWRSLGGLCSGRAQAVPQAGSPAPLTFRKKVLCRWPWPCRERPQS